MHSLVGLFLFLVAYAALIGGSLAAVGIAAAVIFVGIVVIASVFEILRLPRGGKRRP